MKLLFKFFLFICILVTAGPVQHLQSSAIYKTSTFFSLNQHQDGLDNARLTPVIPVGDPHAFQIIEDEEINTSRIKKTQYASLILVFLSAGALLSIIQSLVNNRTNNRPFHLNSPHRYIRLRTIRI